MRCKLSRGRNEMGKETNITWPFLGEEGKRRICLWKQGNLSTCFIAIVCPVVKLLLLAFFLHFIDCLTIFQFEREPMTVFVKYMVSYWATQLLGQMLRTAALLIGLPCHGYNPDTSKVLNHRLWKLWNTVEIKSLISFWYFLGWGVGKLTIYMLVYTNGNWPGNIHEQTSLE
jgi:hypothetical protein